MGAVPARQRSGGGVGGVGSRGMSSSRRMPPASPGASPPGPAGAPGADAESGAAKGTRLSTGQGAQKETTGFPGH